MRKILLFVVSVLLVSNVEAQSLSVKTLIKLSSCSIGEFAEKFEDWELVDVSDMISSIAFHKDSETITLNNEKSEIFYIIHDYSKFKKLLNDFKKLGFEEDYKTSVTVSGDVLYSLKKDDIEIFAKRGVDGFFGFVITDKTNENKKVAEIQRIINDSLVLAKKSIDNYEKGDSLFLNKDYKQALLYFEEALSYQDNTTTRNKIDECKKIIVFLSERPSKIYDFKFEDKTIISNITKILSDDIIAKNSVIEGDGEDFDIQFITDTLGITDVMYSGIQLSEECLKKLKAIKFSTKSVYGYTISYKSKLGFRYTTRTSDIVIIHYNHGGRSYDYYNNDSHTEFNDVSWERIENNNNGKNGVYNIDISYTRLETQSNVSTSTKKYTVTDHKRKAQTIRNCKYDIQDRGKKSNKILLKISVVGLCGSALLYYTANNEYENYKLNPSNNSYNKANNYLKASLYTLALTGIPASLLVVKYSFKF